jgi:aquaporin Z
MSAIEVQKEAAAPITGARHSISWTKALQQHWPEYLSEATGLCLFMISACAFSVLIFHPALPVSRTILSPVLSRLLMGAAMGATAIGITYSPIGGRSGAHLNPSITLMFLRLGKINGGDALWYMLAQFAGGLAGVLISALLLGQLISAPAVNYAVTVPGASGVLAAFLAEVCISFLLMSVVLTVSNTRRWSRLTGLCAGLLVATYITLESPISGMSMNPARTLGSALPARVWTSLYIYFVAPPVGMLLAAEIYRRVRGLRAVWCAKLNHHTQARCIFRCNFPAFAENGRTRSRAVTNLNRNF